MFITKTIWIGLTIAFLSMGVKEGRTEGKWEERKEGGGKLEGTGGFKWGKDRERGGREGGR